MSSMVQCNHQLHCVAFGGNRVCSAYIHDRVMLEMRNAQRPEIRSRQVWTCQVWTCQVWTCQVWTCQVWISEAETPGPRSSAARCQALSPWRPQARVDRRGV